MDDYSKSRAARALAEYERTADKREDPFTAMDLATCKEIGGTWDAIAAALKVGYIVGYKAAKREAKKARA